MYQSRLELAIDSRSGEQSLQRVERGLRGVERAGDKTSESVGNVSTRLDKMEAFAKAAGGALLGMSAGTGVLLAMGRQASQTAAEIQKLSRIAGTSTGEFQRLAYGAAQYGVEQEKLADIVRDTQDRIGDFLQTGAGEFVDFFEQIAPKANLSAEALARMSGPDALQAVYSALENAGLSASEMTFYMEALASDATELIPLLRDSGAEVDRLGREAEELNAVLSDLELQRLKDIRNEFHQFEQQLSTETARAVSQFDELIKSSLEGISWGVNQVARGFNAFMDDFRENDAKRSIAGIDAELGRLFDTKQRLEERIDLFGEDSAQAQDAKAALAELKEEYDALIDRKIQIQQAGQPVTEPEVVQISRASTEFKTLDEWLFNVGETSGSTSAAIADTTSELDRQTESAQGLLDELYPLQASQRQYAEDKARLVQYALRENKSNEWLAESMRRLDESYRSNQTAAEAYGLEVDNLADRADPMADAFQEATRRIDETFADAFQGAFDSFDDFASQLEDAFKRLLAELAYQATLRPIVVGFTADMQRGLGMDPGTNASLSSGFGDVLSTGKNLIQGADKFLGTNIQGSIGSLFGGGSAASSLGVSGGVSGTAISSANAVAGGTAAASGGAMSSLSSFASMAGPYYALASLGNQLYESAGLYDALGIKTGGDISNTLGMIAPIGGTIIGAGLDAVFGSKYSGENPTGTLKTVNEYGAAGRDGFEREVFADSALGRVGFARESRDIDSLFGDRDNFENAQEYAEQLAQMDNTIAQLASSEAELAAMREAAADYGLSSMGDIEGRYDAILGSLTGTFGEFVQGLDGGIEEVVQQGVTARQAFSVMSDAAGLLNLEIQTAGTAAYEAAADLAELAGGVQTLANLQQSYYQAFYSEAERQERQAEALREQFAALNMTMPGTREGFRDLVEAQNRNTEAGRETYLELLNLAGAFDQVAGSSALAADSVDRLGLVQSAYEDLESAVSAEREVLNAAYDRTTSSIRDNISEIEDGMRSTEQLAGSLRSTLDQLNDAAPNGEAMRRNTAQDYLRSVRDGGGLGDQQQLERALSAVSQPSEQLFGSFVDYARDYYQTANVISDLDERAEAQLSTGERQVRALERQLRQADREHQAEMARLDGLLQSQAAQIEAELGQQAWLQSINSSVMSVEEAIRTLDVATATAEIGRGASSGDTSYLDAKADQLNRIGHNGRGDWTASEVADAFADAGLTQAEHYERYGQYEDIPGFATGGIASGPTSGYPVELHGTEAVIPLKGGAVPVSISAPPPAMGGDNALLRELQRLNKRVEALEAELREGNSISRGIADHTSKAAREAERQRREAEATA